MRHRVNWTHLDTRCASDAATAPPLPTSALPSVLMPPRASGSTLPSHQRICIEHTCLDDGKGGIHVAQTTARRWCVLVKRLRW